MIMRVVYILYERSLKLFACALPLRVFLFLFFVFVLVSRLDGVVNRVGDLALALGYSSLVSSCLVASTLEFFYLLLFSSLLHPPSLFSSLFFIDIKRSHSFVNASNYRSYDFDTFTVMAITCDRWGLSRKFVLLSMTTANVNRVYCLINEM